MKRITLTNEANGTSARLIPQPVRHGKFAGKHRISRRTLLRVRHELVGYSFFEKGEGLFCETGGSQLNVIKRVIGLDYVVDLSKSTLC